MMQVERFTTQREVKKVLLLRTSNRGLCGAFNSDVIKALKTVLSFMQENKWIFLQ
jgi:F-type H+-transporting ATPase subunit gamma